jgi:hypothetical protein
MPSRPPLLPITLLLLLELKKPLQMHRKKSTNRFMHTTNL